MYKHETKAKILSQKNSRGRKVLKKIIYTEIYSMSLEGCSRNGEWLLYDKKCPHGVLLPG